MEDDAVLLESAASASFDAFAWVEEALASRSGTRRPWRRWCLSWLCARKRWPRRCSVVAARVAVGPRVADASPGAATGRGTAVQTAGHCTGGLHLRLRVHCILGPGSALSGYAARGQAPTTELLTGASGGRKMGRNVRACFAAVEDPSC
ncbi:hypothetical protein GQ600_5786 [Phytophthora cactorum]|nr:hypothetical protein GQ600_5786 [Phytophthora cactorum]